MAVIVKYIVVRNGEEKMTFVTKKEADAYDKMLDIADNLFDFLGTTDLGLDESQQEEVSLLLAERREDIMPILRGLSLKKKTSPAKAGQPKSPSKALASKAGPVPKTTPGKKTGPAKSPAKNPTKNSAKNPVGPKAASAKKNG